MDEQRQFLEIQVKDAEGRVEEAAATVKRALEAFDASLDDVVTWRKALEKYTRNTDAPYIPPPVPNPLAEILSRRTMAEADKSEPKRERPEVVRTPRATRKFSKRRAVRELLEASDVALNVSEVFEALAKQDLLEPITKYDLYRILPGLYSRGEIERDERGRYSAIPKVREENSLLDGLKESVM